jgi:hypothetical protein
VGGWLGGWLGGWVGGWVVGWVGWRVGGWVGGSKVTLAFYFGPKSKFCFLVGYTF